MQFLCSECIILTDHEVLSLTSAASLYAPRVAKLQSQVKEGLQSRLSQLEEARSRLTVIEMNYKMMKNS
jgi:hypothetical protein